MFSLNNFLCFTFGILACFTVTALACITFADSGTYQMTFSEQSSCILNKTVTMYYNVSWSDGTYSYIVFKLFAKHDADVFTAYGEGTVQSGLFSGLSAKIADKQVDLTNGCNRGVGVSSTSGHGILTIGSASLSGQWRYCYGNTSFLFSPPISVTPANTVMTLEDVYDRCVGSC